MEPVKLRVRQCFHVILFLIILYLLLKTADYYLYNDNTYTRVMFHEMYHSEPIDVAFIGSSNVYRHFDPKIWDETLGMHTFNLGTSSQTPEDAYYIMKELFKSQSPRYCIYGINSILFLELDAYKNPVKNYIIFDYLKPSFNKYAYGYTAFKEKSLLNGWVQATRNADKDLLETIKNVSDIKRTDTYQTYQYKIYEGSGEEYQGRGFVYANRQTEKGAVGKIDGYLFHDYEISESSLVYMKRLKELCDENGTELIFVVPPLPYASMKLQEDYQEITKFYQSVADEMDVALFPFDLSRPEYLLMEDNDFYDEAHLSGKGAERFSRTAAELVKKYMDGEEIDRNKYFYASFEEFLDNSPWIFNTWLEKNEAGYTAQAFYGNGVIPEYCFQWSDDKGKTWHMAQEYSENSRIASENLPDECNMLMVWTRPRGELSEEADYQQCDRMELE